MRFDFKSMRLVGEIDIVILSRLSRKYWSHCLSNSSWNHLYPLSFFFIDRDLVPYKLLISRLTHLVLFLQIYPKLEPDWILIFTFWNFRVNDSFSCCHPLNVSRADFSFVAFEIFMQNVAFLHVSHCLESSMRMVWESCGEFYFEVVKH